MKTIHRTIVSALVFSKDGKLLMGQKDPAKGGVYADCWHIPGGGVDEGEDDIRALRRELLEEVGIDISSINTSSVSQSGTGMSEKILSNGEKVQCEMSFHVYRVELNELAEAVKLQLNDDLVKTSWVDFAQLQAYKVTPPSRDLFIKLGWI